MNPRAALSATQGYAPESRYAWMRLVVSTLLCTLGGVGMWSMVVALPVVQVEFGATRADASMPYTLTMIGFGIGTFALGRIADRFGIVPTVISGVALLAAGYVVSGLAPSLAVFALAHGFLIGIGCGATFAPLMADISLWFTKRRGAAVTIVASGNYLSGAMWPPLVQHFIAADGWRATHIGIAVFCVAVMLPLTIVLRPRVAAHADGVATQPQGSPHALGVSGRTLQILLTVAGIGCCTAMAMPQVHLVAYCGDLGYGVARGAEMLSIMLLLGVVSRIASGFVADRIGGLPTLLLGSALQAFALLLYALFDGMVSLYVISGLFGLFQGGIVPMYAIVVREYFPAREAGSRLGLVLTGTIFGMALGGWMSGFIFDLTGSYRAAFLNGFAWNLLNTAIVVWLLMRQRGARPRAGTPAYASSMASTRPG